MWSEDEKLIRLIVNYWVTYYNAQAFEEEHRYDPPKRQAGAKWGVHTKAFDKYYQYGREIGFDGSFDPEHREFFQAIGQEVKRQREEEEDRRLSRNPKDPRLTRAGVSGYNKPKRTPDHPTKSHVVVAKEGDEVRTIRFGQQGVKGSPKKKGESESYRKRRLAFKARHAKNIRKGKLSPAWWADKVKW